MYWIYLILFVVTLTIPIFIEGDLSYLDEDTAESLLILLVGTAGFLIYIIKEKSLLHHVKEKLWIQQKNSAITKDLSQSYSYIGEVNRKFDIVKNLTKKLPLVLQSHPGERSSAFWEVLDAARLLTQADCTALRIRKANGEWFHLEDTKLRKLFGVITDEFLEQNTKHYFFSEGVHGVASETLSDGTRSFLLFRRQQSIDIDEDVVDILVALLVLLEVTFSAVNQEV
jgi:hypothetical protein